ncbi:pentatricopeptide repeat-containing protein At5g02830, chloroplastic isoform X2 [Tripterygium wilfordii]|uniref:pentatricopeptide repeat-containing protein At5g02830, chloroplastic isoform X2 n=1 Tax=Tripterygium wilfordii TaxID=458696 RepID=UPI0018F7E75F|nr:pentatricopeptide repeat-containing protein At5g02830, chloroplastic isoform X2 [Tripterygium wilfordii]
MRDLLILRYSFSVVVSHNQPHLSKPKLKSSLTNLSISSAPPSPLPTVDSRSPLHSTVSRDCKLRLPYYADLASNLARDGRLHDFAVIVESVIVSCGTASDLLSALNFELVAKGVSQNLRDGKFDSVIDVLRRVGKLGVAPSKLLDRVGLKLVREECQRSVNFGEADKVVDFMEIIADDISVNELVDPSAVLKICVARRNSNLAVRYACTLPHKHIIFCSIISEFGKKGDLVSALTAFEASKENLGTPNMYVFRSIIDTCGLCGDFMRARCIYQDLIKQKITPNIYVFNSLMNVNAHDWSYTFHLYKNMQNLGVTADMATYNILLKACCLAGRVDLAQDIYRDVKRMESSGSLKLDIFTYSTVIKVFADAKLWQMALQVKEDMLTAGAAPNLYTWSALISACANAGRVDRAIQLFEEMLLAGCEPNSQCCNILLHACVEACQYDRAFRLFKAWKGSEFQHITAEDYKDSTESSSNYCRATALMDEMKTAGLSPSHRTWTILIGSHGSLGDVEGALQILKNMRTAGIEPDVVAYTTTIKVCVENKNLNQAFSLFEEMKGYRIQPNLVTYNTLLRARSRYGSLKEVQQCLAIYQDMRKAGFKSNDYYLKELIEEWCEGVIQDNNRNQGELASCKITNLRRSHGVLLESVAAHLQKSNSKSVMVDIQGLTKVEARILVLAVLRMIKENYSQGNLVPDDIWIIIGINNVAAEPARYDTEVKEEISKLLRNELGLEVLLSGSRIAVDEQMDMQSPLDSDQKLGEMLGVKTFPAELESSSRRPIDLLRLKVTKKSLYRWLQKRQKGMSLHYRFKKGLSTFRA